MFRNKIPYQQKYHHICKIFYGVSVTRGDFAKLQFHFPLRGNVLYSKRLILDLIDGPLSFSSFCQQCLKCTK